jgi:hypothetical protein
MTGASPTYRLHNSIDSPEGQASSASGVPSSTVAERLGPVLAAQGFVAAPVALLRGYARLGLSDGELALVLQIWSYWREERLPCPAVSTLATQLGKTERQVQQIVASLRKRGLLTVHPRHERERGQLSNAYDLDPLIRAIEALPPIPARCALGMLPVAEEGVQGAAGEGVQTNAPNEDPRVRSLVLVSDPPPPPAQHDRPGGR